jgi:hypothetical protein
VLCCDELCCVKGEGDTYQCGLNSARLWFDEFLSECMCVYMYQCVYVFKCLCVFIHQFVSVCYEYVSVCVRMSVWGGGGPACNIRVTHGVHNILLPICRSVLSFHD